MSYLVSFSAAPEEHMEDWKVGEFDTWVCCIKESSHHSSTPYKAWTPYKAKTQLSWRSIFFQGDLNSFELTYKSNQG